ncbi:hypothetical protein [Streptococcus fryi]
MRRKYANLSFLFGVWMFAGLYFTEGRFPLVHKLLSVISGLCFFIFIMMLCYTIGLYLVITLRLYFKKWREKK